MIKLIAVGKSYIGSSTNLANRLYLYYNVRFLMRNNRTINKALLKYGYANFSLEILEYCEPKDCIKKEQYYIDLLKPAMCSWENTKTG